MQTVFLIAVPIGALAFLLTWTLKELPLRTTTTAPDPADPLAPTAGRGPDLRQEMGAR